MSDSINSSRALKMKKLISENEITLQQAKKVMVTNAITEFGVHANCEIGLIKRAFNALYYY